MSRPPLRVLRRLTRALRRAGAFGAWHGGNGAGPELALTVAVDRPGTLRAALEALERGGVRATLTVPAALLGAAPELLRTATQAGHELAGAGPLTGLRSGLELCRLDLAVGQAVRAWAADGLGLADLRRLASAGVRALPEPDAEPQPGRRLDVPAAELDARLSELRALGYRPVPLRELPGLRPATPRDLLLYVYTQTLEARFTRQSGVIDLSSRPDGVMRVAPLSRAPAPLPLPRETPTAELHLNSPRIVALNERSSLAAYRASQRSLRDVARALQERPELAGAQAVFAVTLLHGPLEHMGFTLLDLPPLRAWWYGLGFRFLRRIHGTRHASSVERPRMAWMPREAFLKRYG